MPRSSLFILIDGLGWELIQSSRFLADLAPHRYRLRTVLGYSSAALPTILTGLSPAEHGHWCHYAYAPDDSPFRRLPFIRHAPDALARSRRIRTHLAHLIAHHLGWTGRLDLANIPLSLLHVLDYNPKRDPLDPGGLSPATSVIDRLHQQRIPFFLSNPKAPDAENFRRAATALESDGPAPLTLLHATELQGALEAAGPHSGAAREAIAQLQGHIRTLFEAAACRHDELRLYVGTDHGVTPVSNLVDVQASVEATGLRLHRDYFALYDPTLARFWFASAAARHRIMASLADVVHARWLADDQLRIEGILFPDSRYGEAILLLDPGLAIEPSHAAAQPPAAAAGYHPDHPDSWAAFCANTPLAIPPRLIGDTAPLILEAARWATQAP